MRVAILSDVHDNLTNLEKALKFIKLEKIDTILCLGDLGSPETLKFLSDNFWAAPDMPDNNRGGRGRIHYIFGNAEIDLYHAKKTIKKYKNVIFYGQEFGELEIDGKKIAITHWPKTANALAKTGDYDLVFFGHTHKPDIKVMKLLDPARSIILANPGNIAGIFYKPSFAIYDTKNNKLELKII